MSVCVFVCMCVYVVNIKMIHTFSPNGRDANAFSPNVRGASGVRMPWTAWAPSRGECGDVYALLAGRGERVGRRDAVGRGDVDCG